MLRSVGSALRQGAYLAAGRRPWSLGYDDFKHRVVEHSLTEPDLRVRFERCDRLPGGYGRGLDERVVEYPWAISRIDPGPGRLLDAGSTLNFERLLRLPAVAAKTVHIVTLAPEPRCFWHRRISYLFCDLRELPVRDEYYDLIVCISTLEHVGLDNSMYAAPGGSLTGDGTAAIRELRRVLKLTGRLLVTIPYGRAAELSWQRQFDQRGIERLVESFGPRRVEKTIYAYRPDGWQLSDERAAAQAEYYDVHTAERPAEDGAAAARAVACLDLEK